MKVGIESKAARASKRESIEDAIALSKKRFLSDLPDLLKDYRGQWVAYVPGGRIALASDPNRVYTEICKRGLKTGEFLMCCIEPNVTSEIEI